MLKTTIQEKPAAGLTFPCLRRRKNDGIVVLFSDKTTGTVLGDPLHQEEVIGYHTKDWSDAGSTDWEPVYSVTITQDSTGG